MFKVKDFWAVQIAELQMNQRLYPLVAVQGAAKDVLPGRGGRPPPSAALPRPGRRRAGRRPGPTGCGRSGR